MGVDTAISSQGIDVVLYTEIVSFRKEKENGMGREEPKKTSYPEEETKYENTVGWEIHLKKDKEN